MHIADDLIQTLRANPFRPVELKLSTGESIPVTHPEQAVVTDTDAVFVFRPGSREGTFSWRMIGLEHIVSVGSPTNGQQAEASDSQDAG